jgi:stage V sporulation protein AD
MHAGGSGCGCSALVLAAKLLPELVANKMQNILFIGTGALMSPASVQQGDSIPGIAHLIFISTEAEK